VLETESEPPHPVPVERETPKRRGRVAAVVFILVLAVDGTAFGLSRLDPATWNRVTAWMPGSEQAAPPAGSGPSEAPAPSPAEPESDGQGSPADTAGAVRASQAIAAEGDAGAGDGAAATEGGLGSESLGEETPTDAGVETGESGSEAPGVEAADPVELAASQGTASPAPGESSAASREPAEAAETAAIEASPELAMAESAADPSAVPASPATNAVERASPPPPPPRGVVVIGVGDPVIADPMVREIESALRGASHPLVQRSFVPGYRNYVQGEELDLAGLAGPAREAGARYVVVARALPAGERELQYYNRVETAFIAQLEAVTYDLHEMRRLGSSPVEQIEFTALNATRRAVNSVEPWLAGIRAQFD
jgi:serine/threonine-protein kinase